MTAKGRAERCQWQCGVMGGTSEFLKWGAPHSVQCGEISQRGDVRKQLWDLCLRRRVVVLGRAGSGVWLLHKLYCGRVKCEA